MADYAANKTDEVIERCARRIKSDYKKANKECREKLKKHLEQFADKDKEMQEKLKAGEITKHEYTSWRSGQMMTGKRWQDMCDTLAQDYANADKIARSTIAGHMPEVYALNRNFGMYQVDGQTNINTSFTLYDRHTVEKMWRESPQLMRKPKPNESKAIRWNKRHINSAVMQGILQGKSIPDIAKGLDAVAGSGYRSSVMAARTAMTAAQNAGRTDSYKEAEKMGIELEQMWLATLDERTRASHVLMDGEVAPVGEAFSNKLKFPGDPDGAPGEIYNCRCTLIAQVKGHEHDPNDLSWRNSEKIGGMTYEEWVESRTSEGQRLEHDIRIAEKNLSSIEIKTYSGIWRQDVKTSDYDQYKDRIQGKRDYFNQQLRNLDANDPRRATFEQYLRDLDEFELDGFTYSLYAQELADAKKRLRDYKRANEDPADMFSQSRKDAALWFDKKAGGFRAADAYFDPPAKKVHAGATPQEHDGFFTYTSKSGGHNRPLAGYQKPWSQYGSGWEEEFYVGPNKVWIDYENKGDQIRGLTKLIEKSTYDQDVWLQSGQDYQTLEGSLGLTRNTLENMSEQDIADMLVGKEFELGQFISSAVNKGGGGCFNTKPTKWNIYAPSGSQMLYASDVGAYGKGENEMILQRGGSYKITRVYFGNDATDGNRRKLFVDMELHPEKGYNTFQQDPSEWKGSKKNYRS